MRKILTILLAGLLLLIAFFASYVYVTNRPLAQNEYDIAILEKTVELLSDENIWSKNGDRTCDETNNGLSLYCALSRASVEITGDFMHRAAALQEVRYEIDRQKPETEYEHRLMDYNNDESVDFEEMHEMLQASLQNLRQNWLAIKEQQAR